jgi:ABC-type phosphate transport system ATPase subunit
MPNINVLVSTEHKEYSIRARQVSGMFDVPLESKQTLSWDANLPIEEKPWNVGLIVGPSGAGKSIIGTKLWPDKINKQYKWTGPTIIDCFSQKNKIDDISAICQAVGFNTIPAWLRPFNVLSNGEQFRVQIARALLEMSDPIVIDEFSSVVDRQVAQITSHAVQKYIRKNNKQFVAVTCHYDIIDWLQPDWIYDPSTNNFQWRLLRRRPQIKGTISRVEISAWGIFKKYHYMSAQLHHSAQCFGLWVGENIAAFAAVIVRPHAHAKNIFGVSRLVTLPDYQGLGLAFILADILGAAYNAIGRRLHTYPAHPALIRGFNKSEKWTCVDAPGTVRISSGKLNFARQYRPNAVFRYIGESMDRQEAVQIIRGC